MEGLIFGILRYFMGLFYEGTQKLQKVMTTIMNAEIMNTFPKTFSRIVAISTTTIFLPSMLASLYFYSFPSSSTTTTTSSIGGTELTSFLGGGNLIRVGGNKLTSLTS